MARIDYDDDPYDREPESAPSPPPRPPEKPTIWQGLTPPPPVASYTAPSGVPQDWAEDFIRRNQNPGGGADYHRVLEAYRSNNISRGSPGPAPGPSPWQATMGQFNDPYTQQYEGLAGSLLELYKQQQAEMQAAAERARVRRGQTEAAVNRLQGYTNERIAKLQGPAYTGSEQEVLRTQLLDPLERDRTAAQRRALEQISGRGMERSSGIADELLLQVNRAFDEQRTRAQGTIATRQIEEQRSREQEAQQLLQYLAQLPDAVARGDLDFVNYVQGLISQPGQQALTVGQMLSDLPRERLNDALATLGIAPNMGGTSSQLMQLLQQQQQQRQFQQQMSAGAWGNFGRSFLPSF